jgi:transposase
MVLYPKSARERAMKIQEVISRAMAKKITWGQAAEIIGISDRRMRRWFQRYQEFGYDGLFDRRLGCPARSACQGPSKACWGCTATATST